jgi:hypothetical protein
MQQFYTDLPVYCKTNKELLQHRVAIVSCKRAVWLLFVYDFFRPTRDATSKAYT